MVWVCMGGIGLQLFYFKSSKESHVFPFIFKEFNISASFIALECIKIALVFILVTFTILSWIQGQSLIGEIAHVHIFIKSFVVNLNDPYLRPSLHFHLDLAYVFSTTNGT